MSDVALTLFADATVGGEGRVPYDPSAPLGSPARPIRIVSLFCGLGGSDMGVYEAAKELGLCVQVVAAIDSWEVAVRAYNANLPHAVAKVADVKKLNPEDLPDHDLIIGGPPCQPFSLAGQRKGRDDERDCVPDFVRLTRNGKTPFIMENVVDGLLTPYGIHHYQQRFLACDYGDVTSRRRWFYTNLAPWGRDDDPDTLFGSILRVVSAPSPRRFGDIRDHEADRRYIERMREMQAKTVAWASQQEMLPPADADEPEKEFKRKKGDTRFVRTLDSVGDSARLLDEGDVLGSNTAHAWHGYDVRGGAKLVPVQIPLLSSEEVGNRILAESNDKVTIVLESEVGEAVAAQDDDVMGSIAPDAMRTPSAPGISMVAVVGQSEPTDDDGTLGSLTTGHGGVSGFLRVQVVEPHKVVVQHDLTREEEIAVNALVDANAPADADENALRELRDRAIAQVVSERPIAPTLDLSTLSQFSVESEEEDPQFGAASDGTVPGDYARLMEEAHMRGRSPQLIGDSETMGTVTSQSWHGINSGKSLVPIADTQLTDEERAEVERLFEAAMERHAESGEEHLDLLADEFAEREKAIRTVLKKRAITAAETPTVAMRGFNGTLSPIQNDGHLNGLTANADKALPRIVGVRCPSLLEMSRSHSISDDFDYAGATKDQRGKLIANSWPVGMARAVMKAVFTYIQAEGLTTNA